MGKIIPTTTGRPRWRRCLALSLCATITTSGCTTTVFQRFRPEAVPSSGECIRLQLTERGRARLVATHGDAWLTREGYGVVMEGDLLEAAGDSMRIRVARSGADATEYCERRGDIAGAAMTLRGNAADTIAVHFADVVLIEGETTDWAKTAAVAGGILLGALIGVVVALGSLLDGFN